MRSQRVRGAEILTASSTLNGPLRVQPKDWSIDPSICNVSAAWKLRNMIVFRNEAGYPVKQGGTTGYNTRPW